MTPLTITVPGVPPSVNLGRSKHWTKVTQDTSLYRALAAVATREAVAAWDGNILDWQTRPLRCVIWHYPDTLRGDAHNREKVVVDGLVDGLNMALGTTTEGLQSGKVFNDSRIAILSMHPQRNRDKPCVVCVLGLEADFNYEFKAAGGPDAE